MAEPDSIRDWPEAEIEAAVTVAPSTSAEARRAVAASLVNRCIYCAAVHSNRYNQLAKDETVIEGIFGAGEAADLDPRQKAIFNFATKLSECPSEAGEADVRQLIDAGLGMDEIFDLVLTASLFGWANRLMHVLGDPIPRES